MTEGIVELNRDPQGLKMEPHWLNFDLSNHALSEFESIVRPGLPNYYLARLRLKMKLDGSRLSAELRFGNAIIHKSPEIFY
jgi:hypothetical protein